MTTIETRAPLKGYKFYATDIVMPDELEAEIEKIGVLAMMRKADSRYQAMPDHLVIEAFQKGALRGTNAGPTELVATNQLVDGFFVDLFALYMETATADQTLGMRFLAIGTRYGVPVADGQTGLENELFRFGPTDRYTDSRRKFYFSRYLTHTQANPAGATTVAAGTWTATTFDVVNASAFAINDRIEIYTSADGLYTPVTITGKTGNTLTVANGALAVAPVEGDAVIPMHGEIAIFLSPATSDLGSGKMADRAIISQKKTSAAGKYYNAVFNHLAVSQ